MSAAAPVENGYQSILNLYQEVAKAQDADALMAALAMVFVGIDTMAWLSLPIETDNGTRNDFCAWVDTYLKTGAEQPYQYVGIDVYAARCALLHSYGSIADLHKSKNPPKIFGYLDNGPHQTDGSPLVLISIAVLIHDFGSALNAFLTTALKDTELKARIDSRINALVRTWPVRNQEKKK